MTQETQITPPPEAKLTPEKITRVADLVYVMQLLKPHLDQSHDQQKLQNTILDIQEKGFAPYHNLPVHKKIALELLNQLQLQRQLTPEKIQQDCININSQFEKSGIPKLGDWSTTSRKFSPSEAAAAGQALDTLFKGWDFSLGNQQFETFYDNVLTGQPAQPEATAPPSNPSPSNSWTGSTANDDKEGKEEVDSTPKSTLTPAEKGEEAPNITDVVYAIQVLKAAEYLNGEKKPADFDRFIQAVDDDNPQFFYNNVVAKAIAIQFLMEFKKAAQGGKTNFLLEKTNFSQGS